MQQAHTYDMDPLSITAGILAVLGALAVSIETAKEVWAAPNELQGLAGELNLLASLAENLAVLTQRHKFEEAHLGYLADALKRLQDTENLFQERILKRRRASVHASPFRHMTWMVQRGSIKKITREVDAVGNNLNRAMQLLTLLVL